MISDLVSLIFPKTCIHCNQSLVSSENVLCTTCKIDLPRTNDHQNPENDLIKKFAFEPKVIHASSFLYFSQGGIVQKLLHQLKYQNRKDIGTQIGEWYSEFIDYQVDMIVPVPLHRSKLKKRGYNQSEYFANGLSKKLGIEVDAKSVVRTIATTTQTKKSKVRRWTDLESVYAVKDPDSLSDKSVMVVDDVITTGATIGMLCASLINAGVANIYVSSIARGQ